MNTCFLLFVFIFLVDHYGKGKKGGRIKKISVCSDNHNYEKLS